MPSILMHSAFDFNTLLTMILAVEKREEDPFKQLSIMEELDNCSPLKDCNQYNDIRYRNTCSKAIIIKTQMKNENL